MDLSDLGLASLAALLRERGLYEHSQFYLMAVLILTIPAISLVDIVYPSRRLFQQGVKTLFAGCGILSVMALSGPITPFGAFGMTWLTPFHCAALAVYGFVVSLGALAISFVLSRQRRS